MRDFKKALISTMLFLLVFVLISVIIIEPYIHSELLYYNDASRRKDLAGSIDCEIIGASHALTSLIPNVIDENLNCSSYNLAGSLMTWKCRSAVLNEEIDRNPIKTLYLEVSYNSMVLPKKVTESNIYTYPRIDAFSKRVNFICRNQTLLEFDVFLADAMNSGLTTWEGIAYKIYKSRGKNIKNALFTPYNRDLNYDNKGFLARSFSDITLSKEEVTELYAKKPLDTNFRDYNVIEMKKIVDDCRDRNIEVVVIIVPISDNFLWCHSGWDDFQTKISTLCEECDCKLYDFNLLRNRYSLFSDDKSFSDDTHLCQTGAELFSSVFCDVIKESAIIDPDSLFYSTYSEMISDSPYMKYLNLNK